jgi:hypothetical protein
MKLTDGIPPTTPFHLARAYGLAAPAGAVPGARAGAAAAGQTREVDARGTDPAAAARISRLVAAVVPGGVDFNGPELTAGAGVLPMYRRSAEKNAAATGVVLGRKIDVRG